MFLRPHNLEMTDETQEPQWSGSLPLLPLPENTTGVYVTTPPFQFSGSLTVKVTPQPKSLLPASIKEGFVLTRAKFQAWWLFLHRCQACMQASPDPVPRKLATAATESLPGMPLLARPLQLPSVLSAQPSQVTSAHVSGPWALVHHHPHPASGQLYILL